MWQKRPFAEDEKVIQNCLKQFDDYGVERVVLDKNDDSGWVKALSLHSAWIVEGEYEHEVIFARLSSAAD